MFNVEYSMSRRGFTLAELLIAMSIFLMVTLITIMSFRAGEKVEQLRFAMENVAQEVRALQVFARTGQRQGGVVPKGGFGIRILQCSSVPCTLIPFGDQNSDGTMTGGEAFGEALTLAPKVVLDGVVTKDAAGIVTQRPAVFLITRSPYGDFQVNDPQGSIIPTQELVLTLKHLELGRTRTLRINIPSGQVQRE